MTCYYHSHIAPVAQWIEHAPSKRLFPRGSKLVRGSFSGGSSALLLPSVGEKGVLPTQEASGVQTLFYTSAGALSREQTVGIFGPRRHSKARGEHGEAVITARLLEAGYNVLVPYGDAQRYDLVIEDADGKFWKIQCKVGWMDKECVRFNTSSNHYQYRGGKDNYTRRGYVGQIDYFAVYSPDTGKVYLVPVDHAGKTDMWLRLTPAKTRNQHDTHMAEDYEL